MALWPFGKNKDKNNKEKNTETEENASRDGNQAGLPEESVLDNLQSASGESGADAQERAQSKELGAAFHDPVNGKTGPYDGDLVNIEDFDFSDFSLGLLELGSLKVPLPKQSQVQVEMGEAGPRMLHIVTQYGRITPIAFAAPRSPGQWAETAADLLQGVASDGLETHVDNGPWGSEIVGENENGLIRIIGVEGPRWLLRFTLAAPKGKEDELAQLGREVIARTFVYRGEDPILAGNSLPISMPQPLVDQIQKAMVERQAQQQKQAEDKAAQSSAAEKEAVEQMRRIREQQANSPGSPEFNKAEDN